MTVEQVAGAFGVERRTVYDWVNKGCQADRSSGKFSLNLPAVVSWKIQQERERILGEFANIDEAQARKRIAAAEAALKEHELATKTNAVVPIELYQQAFGRDQAAVRQKLLGMGSKLGPELALSADPLECKDIVDGAVREALEELSAGNYVGDAGGAELPGDPSRPGEVVGAPAGPDGERVGRRRAPAKPRKQRRAGSLPDKQD